MSEVKKLSLRIPKELHKELKILAAKDDKTMNDIICDMIVQYIVNSHKKRPHRMPSKVCNLIRAYISILRKRVSLALFQSQPHSSGCGFSKRTGSNLATGTAMPAFISICAVISSVSSISPARLYPLNTMLRSSFTFSAKAKIPSFVCIRS